jgi:hypothetical protein
MSREALERLMPTYRALVEVRGPNLPIEVAFQEAETLANLVERPEAREELLAVGLDEATLAGLRPALEAARQAQSEWTAIYSPRKPQAQRDVEEQGRALRAQAMSACRFTLRKSRVAQGALDAIDEGEGLADLVQDLFDLALVIEQNAAAFAANRRFPPAEKVAALREQATAISGGQADFRNDKTQRDAADLRNRAWTWLDEVVGEIRQAGQHAFEGTPTAREFASAYLRSQRRQQRHRKAAGAVVTPEPVPV